MDKVYGKSNTIRIISMFAMVVFLLTLVSSSEVAIGEVLINQKIFLKSQYLMVIYSYVLIVINAVFNFFMGATIDLQIICHYVYRPIGPTLGLFCQYGIMPSVAYCLGLLLFPEDYTLRLGLFLNGSCPGGGPSNMWTHLFGGSLNLSITMTTISILAAFGAVPLWVLTVGPTIAADGSFVIPFWDLALTLFYLVVPLIAGIIAQKVFPKFIKYAKKIMTPVSVGQMLYVLTFGFYSYFFIVYLFTWKIIVAVFLQQIFAYTLGFLLARVCRLTLKEAIAVALETGIQNNNIAFIILALAIEQPLGSLAAVTPGAYSLFSPMPLFIVYIIKRIYGKVRGVTLEESRTIPELLHNPGQSNELHQNGHDSSGYIKKQELDFENGIENPTADLQEKANS